MNPLNDDELDALLRQAKPDIPQSSPAFQARVIRSYEEQSKHAAWGWLLWTPVRIPAGFGILAALVLLALGAIVGRTLLAPAVKAQNPIEIPVERIVYRECTPPSHTPEPLPGGLTFKELQPVREIRPRIVRSVEDDR